MMMKKLKESDSKEDKRWRNRSERSQERKLSLKMVRKQPHKSVT